MLRVYFLHIWIHYHQPARLNNTFTRLGSVSWCALATPHKIHTYIYIYINVCAAQAKTRVFGTYFGDIVLPHTSLLLVIRWMDADAIP